MAIKMMGHNEYSPVMVCGASAASWSHKPDEPTMIDRLANMFKRTNDAGRSVVVDRGAVPAHGIVG